MDSKFIMFVSQDKRSKAGPAPLTMSANIKSNMEAFIQNMRPRMAKEGVNNIFVTKNGTSFQEWTIDKCVTLFVFVFFL